jgi:hypothetical protein
MDALFVFCIQQGLAATRSLLDDVRSVGVNYLLVQLYYNFSSWTTLPANQPPRVTPSPLTPWPSHTRDTLQIAYFDVVDDVLAEMEARGIVAHLMVYVGNKNVLWPVQRTAADDVFWRYVLARFGAANNLIWDVSKEAGSYGVGADYIHNRLRLIASLNAHGRVVGAHSGVSAATDFRSNQCNVSLCSLLPARARAVELSNRRSSVYTHAHRRIDACGHDARGYRLASPRPQRSTTMSTAASYRTMSRCRALPRRCAPCATRAPMRSVPSGLSNSCTSVRPRAAATGRVVTAARMAAPRALKLTRCATSCGKATSLVPLPRGTIRILRGTFWTRTH